jgi:hypothetical protein
MGGVIMIELEEEEGEEEKMDFYACNPFSSYFVLLRGIQRIEFGQSRGGVPTPSKP